MKLMRSALAMTALCAASTIFGLDIPTKQVLLDVKFLTTPSSDLKDLGVDWGWGLGATLEFNQPSNPKVTPFVKVDFQRQEGDNDLRSDSYGVGGGIKLQIVPQVGPSGAVHLILSAGYYETKATDILFDEKKKGFGFDVGLQGQIPLLGSIPVISVLFSKRPDTFGASTTNLVIMISPTLVKFND